MKRNYGGGGKWTISRAAAAALGVAAFGGSEEAASAQITFAPPVAYPSGDQTFGVVAVDMNGDEKLDLVACNANANNVRVFIGQGDGTFLAMAPTPVPGRPIKVAAGDLNGDGLPDAVTANISAGGITVLLNSGGAALTPAGSYAMASSTLDIALADFDGDGKLDVVTVNRFGHNATLRLGNGDGTFGELRSMALGAEAGPGALAVGDLDGDGVLDIVTANSIADTISVLRGVGGGFFAPAVNYSAGEFPNSVTIGDVNGDGFADVVATSLTGADVRVYLNVGDGSGAITDPGAGLPVGEGVRRVRLADLDSSGGLDIIIANCVDDTLWIYGDMFDVPAIIMAGDCPEDIALGDFNGDGKIDIATADYVGDSVSVLLNTSPVAPPAPFDLLSPKDGAVNVATNATLVWSAHPQGEVSYMVKIALDAAFAQIEHEGQGDREGFYEIPPGALQGDRTYYWMVTAGNPGGETAAGPKPGYRVFYTPRTGDLNGDGAVNSEDLAILLGRWGGPG